MTALITGISGQDGSYLSELLLGLGYEVHGILRRNSVPENQTYRIQHLLSHPNLHLHYGDMLDITNLVNIINKIKPNEIYNLAAQSHVQISFEQPVYTSLATGQSVLNLLEAVRLSKLDHTAIKIYQASSSEMFGNNVDVDGFQRETTPFAPVSPYGCAKVFAHNICTNYRNAYDMQIWQGILFNHESPRRGINFVTNKVAKAVADVKKAINANKALPVLHIGNIYAKRDWGHAKDYVRAMHTMLQKANPDAYVFATGVTHSVQYLLEVAFGSFGLDWKEHTITDEKYFRPEELHYLKGDMSKLKSATNWQPKIKFEEMILEMVDYWIDK